MQFSNFALTFSVSNEVTKQPSDERSAGGSGEGEPSLCGSPDRSFLLYRQRHVFFSAGRKENVGLEQWVLENATLRPIKGSTHQVRETDTCSTHESFPQEPAARYFPPPESTQRSLGRFDAPQTPGDSSSAGGLATKCTSVN